MQLFRFCCLMLLCHSSEGQTCIIALKTPTKIIVGADSKSSIVHKIVLKNGKIVTKSVNSTICKIGGYNNIYFALSGETPSNNLRLPLIACMKATSFEQAIELYSNLQISFLDSCLLYLKENFRHDYDSIVKSGHMSSALFWTIKNGSTRLHMLLFEINKKSLKIECQEKKYDNPKSSAYAGIGHAEILSQIPDPMNYLLKNEDRGIEQLILKQINITPKYVGRPISILTISNSGIIWYPTKNICN